VSLVSRLLEKVPIYRRGKKASLAKDAVEMLGEVEGSHPNAPREDLARITEGLIRLDPDVNISFEREALVCERAGKVPRNLAFWQPRQGGSATR
jgi:hypothetical protein